MTKLCGPQYTFCSAFEGSVLLGCSGVSLGDTLGVPRQQDGLIFKGGNVH
jgi:small basic protein